MGRIWGTIKNGYRWSQDRYSRVRESEIVRTVHPNEKDPTKFSGFLVVMLGAILWAIDLYSGFNGFNLDSLTYLNWRVILAVPINVFLFLNMFLYFMKPAGSRVILSRMLFIWIILDIWVLGGTKGGGIYHILIPFMIWLLWARRVCEDEASANITIAVIILIDFVGYGLLQSYLANATWVTTAVESDKLLRILSNRAIIPIWLYYGLFNSYTKTGSTISEILLIILLSVNIFFLFDGASIYNARTGTMSTEQMQDFYGYWREGWGNFKQSMKDLWNRGKLKYEDQMEYATGGYYKGKVEEKAEATLGVFIENVQTSSNKYLVDEPVIIWADLIAQTLKDPIGIIMNCTSGEGDNIRYGTVKPDYYKDKPINFNIITMEEESIQCKFAQLPSGSQTVIFSAEFNFETLSYLKTYYMDIERKRALQREGIDPLNQYGITDKKPSAIYTNGPVKIGIGTKEQLPVGLGQDYIEKPKLGITVENQWNGKIKNISSICISIPKSMKLEEEDNQICNGWFDFASDSDKECETLKDDDYLLYKMTYKLKSEINREPIETFISRLCFIEIEPNDVEDVLGNTPIAIHYYRAAVQYVYQVENTLSVSVIKKPGVYELKTCDDPCPEDKCWCSNPNCDQLGRKDLPRGQSCGVLKDGATDGGTGDDGPIDPKAPKNLILTIKSLDGRTDVTNSRNVKLDLYVENAAACRYTNVENDWSGSGWPTYTGPGPINDWELSEGYGQKTVYAQCKNWDDSGEYKSETVSDTINYQEAAS